MIVRECTIPRMYTFGKIKGWKWLTKTSEDVQGCDGAASNKKQLGAIRVVSPPQNRQRLQIPPGAHGSH